MHLAPAEGNARPDGVHRRSDEHYFWCPVPSTAISRAHLMADERVLLVEFRWWELDDPALQEVTIFPEGFVGAARAVLTHGRPEHPRRLGPAPPA